MRLSIDALVAQQSYIKDSQLAEYLEDKNLTPPSEWDEVAHVEIRTRYEEARLKQMEQQLIGVGIKTDRLSIAALLDLISAELKKANVRADKAEGTVVYLKDNAVTNAKLNGY